MGQFEIMFITKPLSEINIDKTIKQVENCIVQLGGKIINSDIWGERHLAYEMNGYDCGCYVLDTFKFPLDKDIQQLHTLILNNENVIRHMIIRK